MIKVQTARSTLLLSILLKFKQSSIREGQKIHPDTKQSDIHTFI